MNGGSTHWDDCWREHLGCAVEKIERMVAEVANEHERYCELLRSHEKLSKLAEDQDAVIRRQRDDRLALRAALKRYMAAFPHEHALNDMVTKALRGATDLRSEWRPK